MDTIFAVATAPIKSGVAVIRISGLNAGMALTSLTCLPLPKKRLATLAKLYNPASMEIIDEALILWFEAPASFTGENISELHIHGGRAVIAEILNCLSNMDGLRPAEPGEFSRRAFENGKMDLTEAEGLADLIDAETKMQARIALRQKQGDLGKLYEYWRETILLTLANIEAYIDFPDEDIPENIVTDIENKVAQLCISLTKHLDDNRKGERLRNGIFVTIIGPPNAGKSSLINILAKRDVAIVSEYAGTTRDVIDVHLDLAGYPVIISDTAGIRDNAGEIEAEGIKRAIARAEDADFTIVVFDAESFIDSSSDNLLNSFSNFINDNSIIVINKADLVEGAPTIPNIFGKNVISASFKNGKGIEEILSSIKIFAEENFNNAGDPVITRERHRILIKDALTSLKEFSLGKDIELAAEDLRYASNSIGRITGRINVEEILDKIFSSFCIGK